MSTMQANDLNPQDVFYGERGTTYAVTKKAPSGTDNTEQWGNSRVTAIKRCNDAVLLDSKKSGCKPCPDDRCSFDYGH